MSALPYHWDDLDFDHLGEDLDCDPDEEEDEDTEGPSHGRPDQ